MPRKPTSSLHRGIGRNGPSGRDSCTAKNCRPPPLPITNTKQKGRFARRPLRNAIRCQDQAAATAAKLFFFPYMPKSRDRGSQRSASSKHGIRMIALIKQRLAATASAAHASNGSRKARARSSGHGCRAGRSQATRYGSSFMRLPTISAQMFQEILRLIAEPRPPPPPAPA